MYHKDILVTLANHHVISKKKSIYRYNYLICLIQLPDLIAEGKVVAAQATITNHTAITTEKLLLNHTTWEITWEDVKVLNCNN